MNAADTTITRKELVALSGYRLTDRMIRSHERAWGLYDCRLKFCQKPVVYDRVRALLILMTVIQ